MEQILLSALPGMLSGMVVAAVSAVFGAAVGYTIGHFRREGKKSKALENGVKGLLRAKILDLGLHYIDEGHHPALWPGNPAQLLRSLHSPGGRGPVRHPRCPQMRKPAGPHRQRRMSF